MYNNQEMADRIKARAKELNISLKDLLTECGLGINFVQQIAKGSNITASNLTILADKLGVSTDYLLGLDSNFTPNLDNISFAFYHEMKDLSEESKQTLLDMAKFLHDKEQGEK